MSSQASLIENLPLLAHRVQGKADGPWLTFVPGIGNDGEFWAAQVAVLQEHFRILTFDPWGHGASPAPPPGCGFNTVVSGIVRLWDHAGIETSSVVGLGFGGSTALALALEHPQRVNRVVGCCCRPRQPDNRRDFWRERRAKAPEIGMAKLADITVDRWLSEEFREANPEIDQLLRAMFRRMSIEGYQAYVNAFIEMDFADRLSSMQVPTMLVAGEHDKGGGPVTDMQAMAEKIAGARFEVIKDAGHIIPFEAPDVVTGLLQDFLGETS